VSGHHTGWHEMLLRRAVYPAVDFLAGTHLMQHICDLDVSRSCSCAQVEELQTRTLRALLRHAFTRVPYYGDLAHEHGIDLEHFRGVSDLTRLPFLTKDLVRERRNELTSDDWHVRRPLVCSTSGSTGNPMSFLLDRECVAMGWACLFHSWAADGYRLGDRRVTVRGTAISSHPSLRLERLRRRVENNLCLSSHAMGPARAIGYGRDIARFGPRVVRGHPSALAAIAAEVLDHDVSIIGVLAVYTTGEQLTTGQRQTIESAFHAPVRDQYGLNDGGAMILQCPNSGCGLYHVVPEKAIVEIVRDDGTRAQPGEVGEIVTTDLYNYSMPFIRYRTGDLAAVSPETCQCGRRVLTLSRIEGRRMSSLRRQNGTRASGLVLLDAFERLVLEKPGAVSTYRVVQERDLSIHVLIVPGTSFDASVPEIINTHFRTHLGGGLPITVEAVGSLPENRNGKRHFVVSHAE
jgi:phenylacetate-CoA ligase